MAVLELFLENPAVKELLHAAPQRLEIHVVGDPASVVDLRQHELGEVPMEGP